MNQPLLTGKTIFCLATQEWDANWTSVQHVMLRLAPHNRIIYFEPFHPPLAWLFKKNRRLRNVVPPGGEIAREVHPNLFVYRPKYPYLPWNMKLSLCAYYNGPLYKLEIRKLFEKLNVEKPLLWAFFAQNLSVLDLPFEYFIYDCLDEWAAFFPHPAERRFISHIDKILCQRADLVFVGSEPLCQTKSQLNPKTFVVNHAADIAHFSKAADEQTVVPEDLARIKQPRIGFVGMVDGVRFNVDLITQLSDNPSYQVVIVGGFVGDAEKLIPKKPNIHLLGMKTVAQLPAYLKGMDVCLMPYRINEATKNIYPLKLHEYLATGKPVVTTAIPAVEEFRNLLYVADCDEDFAPLVKQALAEANPQKRQERQACASRHDWQTHVDQKVQLIKRHFYPL